MSTNSHVKTYETLEYYKVSDKIYVIQEIFFTATLQAYKPFAFTYNQFVNSTSVWKHFYNK